MRDISINAIILYKTIFRDKSELKPNRHKWSYVEQITIQNEIITPLFEFLEEQYI